MSVNVMGERLYIFMTIALRAARPIRTAPPPELARLNTPSRSAALVMDSMASRQSSLIPRPEQHHRLQSHGKVFGAAPAMRSDRAKSPRPPIAPSIIPAWAAASSLDNPDPPGAPSAILFMSGRSGAPARVTANVTA